jgi:hypothetical protein
VVRRRLVLGVLLAVGLTACGSSGRSASPSATVPTTAAHRSTTTQARTPEQEVEAAYLKSWDVYSKAVRNLDPTGLEQSYGENALGTVRAEIDRLSRAGTPVVVQVEHNVHVQVVDPMSALVRDRYSNRNYRVDRSGKPLDDPNDVGTYLDTYQMRKGDGEWRVVRIVRESYQP